jgi:hypothetical protein
MSLESRFWEKVDKESGYRAPNMTTDCWLWTAAKNRAGYGKFFIEKINRKAKFTDAHRVAWQIANGPIPDGLFVLHRCDMPSCVRPDHLFLGTNRDNALDCMAKRRNSHNLPRTHCPHGHLLDVANTYLRPSRNVNHAPARVCRTCTRDATKRWEANRHRNTRDS